MIYIYIYIYKLTLLVVVTQVDVPSSMNVGTSRTYFFIDELNVYNLLFIKKKKEKKKSDPYYFILAYKFGTSVVVFSVCVRGFCCLLLTHEQIFFQIKNEIFRRLVDLVIL